MKVIDIESIIFADVDDTLIMWGGIKTSPITGKPYPQIAIKNPHDASVYKVTPNKGNIKIIKDRRSRGSVIVVWSAGGYAWAEAVVRALDLEKHVDLVMTKPHGYIDDKEAKDIMGERIYIPLGSGYGE